MSGHSFQTAGGQYQFSYIGIFSKQVFVLGFSGSSYPALNLSSENQIIKNGPRRC